MSYGSPLHVALQTHLPMDLDPQLQQLMCKGINDCSSTCGESRVDGLVEDGFYREIGTPYIFHGKIDGFLLIFHMKPIHRMCFYVVSMVLL